MMGLPLLSLIVAAPFVAALILFVVPGAQRGLVRWISLLGASVSLAGSGHSVSEQPSPIGMVPITRASRVSLSRVQLRSASAIESRTGGSITECNTNVFGIWT